MQQPSSTPSSMPSSPSSLTSSSLSRSPRSPNGRLANVSGYYLAPRASVPSASSAASRFFGSQGVVYVSSDEEGGENGGDEVGSSTFCETRTETIHKVANNGDTITTTTTSTTKVTQSPKKRSRRTGAETHTIPNQETSRARGASVVPPAVVASNAAPSSVAASIPAPSSVAAAPRSDAPSATAPVAVAPTALPVAPVVTPPVVPVVAPPVAPVAGQVPTPAEIALLRSQFHPDRRVYLVTRGRRVGIFANWTEADAFVVGLGRHSSCQGAENFEAALKAYSSVYRTGGIRILADPIQNTTTHLAALTI